ncbi:protein NYNRIN-like [Asparagus officinalis]|uniref:protein NYNRIN-like n=1 Tax=Asparagus officinalis TaxID=4686 RepID=UPI00098E8569|nr:protein NYNRIN-like [Asparagus officinalis]
MDIVGPITLPTVKGHRFILAVTDYFSKWAEAISLKEVKDSNVIKFIKYHLIYHLGIPRRIVHDNRTQFVSGFQRFYDRFRIQSVTSMAYYPPANELAEAFNKTIVKLLKKFVSKSCRD